MGTPDEQVGKRRVHYFRGRSPADMRQGKRRRTPRARRFTVGGGVTVGLRRFSDGDVVATGKGVLKNVSSTGIAVTVTFPEQTTVGIRDRFDIMVTGGPLKGLVIGGRLKHETRINGATRYGLRLFGASNEDKEILARGISILRKRGRARRKNSAQR